MNRTVRFLASPAALVIFASCSTTPQTDPSAAQMPMESTRAVAGGGISLSGWTGQIDANEAAQGQVLANTKLASNGNAIHVTTGPAVAYWHPSNRASGDYTVKASFNEPQYMSLNDHPHPYGLFIGGNDMGTAAQSYLYCAANGNGSFIVRGFGPAAFQMNGRRGEVNAAVNKAAAKGSPVTNDIAISVAGDRVQCAINGTVVATYSKADLVGTGKLKSTDGIYGIRFAHNTEGLVSALTVTKP
jgi:hypothetical protein